LNGFRLFRIERRTFKITSNYYGPIFNLLNSVASRFVFMRRIVLATEMLMQKLNLTFDHRPSVGFFVRTKVTRIDD